MCRGVQAYNTRGKKLADSFSIMTRVTERTRAAVREVGFPNSSAVFSGLGIKIGSFGLLLLPLNSLATAEPKWRDGFA